MDDNNVIDSSDRFFSPATAMRPGIRCYTQLDVPDEPLDTLDKLLAIRCLQARLSCAQVVEWTRVERGEAEADFVRRGLGPLRLELLEYCPAQAANLQADNWLDVPGLDD